MESEEEQPFTGASERLARRHRIADVRNGALEVLKGEVSCKLDTSLSNADDEIPF